MSNISDMAWLGIHRTLHLMVPLLQTPVQNPHVTIIALFMNAVEETLTDEDRMQSLTLHSRATKSLLKFLPPNGATTFGATTSRYNPAVIKYQVGRNLSQPMTTFLTGKYNIDEAVRPS